MYGEDVEAATKLDPRDAPKTQRADSVESLRDLFRRLDLWNRGEWNGKWHNEQMADRHDRRAVFDAVAGQLELTGYQRVRAWNMYQSLPKGTRTAFSVPLLLFCVSIVAAREDGRYYHPQASSERNDDVFDEVRVQLGFPTKQVSRVYGRVKGEVDL